MVGLDAAGSVGSVPDWDPTREYRWLIATAATIDGFDPRQVEIDAANFLSHNRLLPHSYFRLEADGGHLYLLHQIPEPRTVMLLAWAAALGMGWRLRLVRRRPRHNSRASQHIDR